MVTRKPVPQAMGATGNFTPSSPTASPPPYSAPPIPINEPQAPQSQGISDELQPSADSKLESENIWIREGEGSEKQNSGAYACQPPPPNESLDSLGAGHAAIPNSVSQEMLRPTPTSTNPFLQRQAQRYGAGQDSSSVVPAWGGFAERPPEPHEAPPRPPISQTQEDPPSDLFASLSVVEPSTNPWQPALDENQRVQPHPIPTIQRENSGNEAWSSAALAKQAPTVPLLKIPQQPVLIDIDEPESPAWDEDSDDSSASVQEAPVNKPQEAQQIDGGRHIWEENKLHGLKEDASTAHQFLNEEGPTQPGEGWDLIDRNIGAQEQPPQLSRPVIASSSRSTSSAARPEIPASVIQAQKKETYEIKRISWHDINAAKNPRVSPILVQNANGPCPLLALVNALTLSTPANLETALVETLRSREQVSLGLLLDAVFDELMSGRRGDAVQELPDVSDLYSFLITLHTGMNVNPLFFPSASTGGKNDPRNSMIHVHPSEREELAPGTFEDTREMKLYSTFSVPLIHGWLPEPGSTECTGLARSAKSYEDAQNIMFYEEGLEDKLMHEGLSFEEQATLEDIATIKAFFASNATQLTPFGLQTITASLVPGATAILFRNDHFSTLYRHPDTLQLLQLVTDMGYAGHEEVVWESLIDVSGERAEFFSGDFRLVGGASAAPSRPSANESGTGWTAVTGHRRQSQNQSISHTSLISPESHPETPSSPNTEQEDHDMALALQLQEEEEERHRTELARERRERETRLSQRYIERGPQNGSVPVQIRGGGRGGRGGRGSQNGGRGAGVATPATVRPGVQPRRNNAPTATAASIAAAAPAADPEAGIDAPPPSYEQAATEEAYIPPVDHPSHPSSSPNGTNSSRRRASGYSSASSGLQVQTPPGLGRGRRQTSSGPSIIDTISPPRRNMAPGSAQQHGRERDCIVM